MKAGNFLSFQEQYVFWRLTNYFLGVEKYRLIHLHEEKQELWLENTSQKKKTSHPYTDERIKLG